MPEPNEIRVIGTMRGGIIVNYYVSFAGNPVIEIEAPSGRVAIYPNEVVPLTKLLQDAALWHYEHRPEEPCQG